MEAEGEDDVQRRSTTIRSGRRQRNDPRHGNEPCTSLAQSTGMLLLWAGVVAGSECTHGRSVRPVSEVWRWKFDGGKLVALGQVLQGLS